MEEAMKEELVDEVSRRLFRLARLPRLFPNKQLYASTNVSPMIAAELDTHAKHDVLDVILRERWES